jgi:hypothetical protein
MRSSFVDDVVVVARRVLVVVVLVVVVVNGHTFSVRWRRQKVREANPFRTF